MFLRRVSDYLESGLVFLTDPRYRKLHGAILVTAFVLYLFTHYGMYIPEVRKIVADLPYFRLHAIREAEFLLIVAYSAIVFGVRGGLIALSITAIATIPFVLTPYVFDRSPQPDEIRDLALQIGILLTAGVVMVLLYDAENRRRKIETQADVLLETNEAKTGFLSQASFELRTPLTTLYGFSELLLTRDVPEELKREWLERIHRESGRLTEVLDDLLNITRIQSGRMVVGKGKLDLTPIMQEMSSYVSVTTSHHTLRIVAPPHLPTVVGDRDKLTQVLVNYLSNAIKYSPKGGQITLSVSEDEGKQRLVIGVADQGIGIAPEDQAQLFTTFLRVHKPETVGIRGTGLGLYVVKSLVDLMGGEVWVKSEVGKGSTFYLTLPIWRPVVALDEETPVV